MWAGLRQSKRRDHDIIPLSSNSNIGGHHMITSLQNEAQMLINQARNLASLPYSALQQLQQNVQRTQQLLNQAQNIAFDVQRIDQAFQQQYGNVSMSATDQQLVANARANDALKAQVKKTISKKHYVDDAFRFCGRSLRTRECHATVAVL